MAAAARTSACHMLMALVLVSDLLLQSGVLVAVLHQVVSFLEQPGKLIVVAAVAVVAVAAVASPLLPPALSPPAGEKLTDSLRRRRRRWSQRRLRRWRAWRWRSRRWRPRRRRRRGRSFFIFALHCKLGCLLAVKVVKKVTFTMCKVHCSCRNENKKSWFDWMEIGEYSTLKSIHYDGCARGCTVQCVRTRNITAPMYHSTLCFSTYLVCGTKYTVFLVSAGGPRAKFAALRREKQRKGERESFGIHVSSPSPAACSDHGSPCAFTRTWPVHTCANSRIKLLRKIRKQDLDLQLCRFQNSTG